MESIIQDSGSGFQDAYLHSFLLSLEANISISGIPNFSVIPSKIFCGIAHSAESENSRDAVSANT